MDKLDKTMYHLGAAGLFIAAFCWGWNLIHFKFKVEVE